MNKTKRKQQLVAYELFQAKDEFLGRSLKYARDEDIDSIRDAFLQGNYESVWTFQLPADGLERRLEEVFYLSNNIDSSWHPQRPCRSTSVGDIVKTRDEYWIVASVGFKHGWGTSA